MSDMTATNEIEALKARVAHLEENRRYIQNALEMVLSLEDFFADIGGDNHCIDTLLPEAKRRIDAIFPFEVMAFYMVDDSDASFQPVFRYPADMAPVIHREVESMIERGHFAWAIRERRGVVIASEDHSRQYLLHVIATHNQIKGMFGALLPEGHTALPDTALTLLSIILLHVANAAENIAHTDLLKNQSLLLEQQVAERTRALTGSQQELEQAIERASAMAREARAASRAKSDFLAKMSHELRTPLNGIIGMTEVVLSTRLDDNQRRIVEIIGRESFSLLHQINDVLDFSKIESGKLELEKIDFDLRRLMEEVGESFIFQTAENGVALNVFVAPSIPVPLVGDPVRLRQVLLNLTGNAVKFTSRGEILIEATCASLAEHQARIRFSIRDSGIGIAQEKQANIFSSFTQADNSTTRQYGGTGLGTTISKQLVDLMGGAIGVESTPGEGSTFWFEIAFPLPQDNTVPATAAEDTGLTFLVIGANPTTARIITTYLAQLGVHTVTAADCRLPLDPLAGRHDRPAAIDAVIADERIPGGDGSRFVHRIRRLPGCAKAPVFLASSLKAIVEGGDDAIPGIDASLSKPIRYEALKTIVDRITGAVPPRSLNPPEPAAPVPTAHDAADGQDTNKGRILVVDDYEVNREVAFMHLTAAGFRVDLAENGLQAVDAAKETPYDLILMDVQMPVLNGYDATARLRRREAASDTRRRTPIIALTANALKGDEEKCLDAGMDGYLVKPVHRHQLIKTAAHWIGLKGRSGRRASRPVERPERRPVRKSDVMDTATAVEEFGDVETVRMVAAQLRDNVAVQLALIRKSIDNDDRERIRKEAHTIKGGAATMEAGALSAAAARLEKLSPAGTHGDITVAIGELETQFNRFREFLSQWKGS